MQEGKVKLADVSPETREIVRIYLGNLKLKNTYFEQNQSKKIRTFEDAVLYAIEQAQKVPGLEAKIKELENEIERIELQHEVDMTEYDIGDEN